MHKLLFALLILVIPVVANAEGLEFRAVPGWGGRFYSDFTSDSYNSNWRRGGPSLYMQLFWKFSKKFKLGLETGYVSVYDYEDTYDSMDITGSITGTYEFKDTAFAIPFNIVGKLEFLSDTRVTPFIEWACGCANVNHKTSFSDQLGSDKFSDSKTYLDGGFGVGLKIRAGKVGIEPYARLNIIADGSGVDGNLTLYNIGVGVSF